MSNTMEAAVLHAPGDLRIDRVPVPGELGPEDVLVKVVAAGICGSDIGRVMTTGTYHFPTIPGHEFAGVVVDVGRSVTSAALGGRVAVAPLMPCFACDSCARGHYSLCDCYNFLGSRSDGGFAQYVKAPARNLVHVPDSVGLDEAATVEFAATVLHGVQKIDVKAGDAVAVVGVGALGYFAVRFAKLSGASPVVAIDIDESKLALARIAGADACVNAGDKDAVEQVRAAAGGLGADVVMETAGANAGRAMAISVARKLGTILVFGSAHSAVVLEPELFERILRHELSVVGSWNSYSVPFPGREWRDIMRFIARGELTSKPLISHVLSLGEAPETFRRLQTGDLGPYNKILFAPNGVEDLCR
ncbi:L-iditol 2-dehydrogenase [Roseiarcus fermentans]|uniref:L-iditol 2-dehydrogenase n=1 Tax=Roseiarcus fermentans TaxID=1473586 RepID=A0A366FU48_9HYPH|nr:galactitol-1-phosphate 5-dehydrogenase [Roseiarcus fermentans]RBP18117.1 L-iditol 2-dehydrogenase [Roseiarcus fermentans]